MKEALRILVSFGMMLVIVPFVFGAWVVIQLCDWVLTEKPA